VWYNDIYTRRTSLAKRIDIFTRYGWFKKTSLLLFLYALFGFIRYLAELRSGGNVLTQLLSVVANMSLFLLAYTLFKISSVTYGNKPMIEKQELSAGK
jgi:hypothetical protein